MGLRYNYSHHLHLLQTFCPPPLTCQLSTIKSGGLITNGSSTDLEYILSRHKASQDTTQPELETLGSCGIFNPTMGLDSEIHSVLENKQQQQQRIYERIYEVISFSFSPIYRSSLSREN